MIGAYAQQVRVDEINTKILEDLYTIVSSVGNGDDMFIRGDLNGYVDRDRDNLQRIHGSGD